MLTASRCVADRRRCAVRLGRRHGRPGHRNTAEFRGRHPWVEIRELGGPTANQESYAAIFIDCLDPETTSDHKNQTRAALGGIPLKK
jgi:hypothetical protein